MRRRLLALNLALVALGALGLWRLRVERRRAFERYRILSPAPGGRQAPPAEPSGPGPVHPAAYLEAAEKFLFSADRNPTVVVEPPKVKPRPALPQLFGVMNLGAGPIAIMAPAPNTPHKSVRIGETVGEFKLLAAGGDKISLEWEGQTIEAQISEVLVRAAADAAQTSALGAPASAAPAGVGPTVVNPSGETGRPTVSLIGPAVQGSSGVIYQSQPGDNAPHGTIFQGKRKVVRTTPFGTQSWWEDIKN